MPQITISLDALQILSTANPSPYWDDVVVSASLQVGGEMYAVAEGKLGTHGKGATIPLNGLTAKFGVWPPVIDTDELGPHTNILLRVDVVNVRGLPARDVERLIAGLLLATLGGAAGAFIPKDVAKELLILIGAGKGLVGGAVGKVIDKIFTDPPSCVGEMGEFVVSFSVNDALTKPYAWETVWQNFSSSMKRGTWKNSGTSTKPPEGDGCGTPEVALFWSLIREDYVSLPGTTFARRYVPQKAASLEAWFGQWAESPGLPRLQISIQRGTLTGADVVRVSILEQLGAYGGQRIVQAVLDNRVIETGHHLRYFEDTWARVGRLSALLDERSSVFKNQQAGLLEAAMGMTQGFAHAAGGLMVERIAVADLAAEGAPTVVGAVHHAAAGAMQTMSEGARPSAFGAKAAVHGEAETLVDHGGLDSVPVLKVSRSPAAELKALTTHQTIAPSLAGAFAGGIASAIPISDLTESALTIFIPEHGISLALYKEIVTDGSGKKLHESYAVRYTRGPTIRATQTDVMLGRPLIVK